MGEDWLKLKINDVGSIVSGGTPRTSIKEYWGGKISWISPSDLTNYNKVFIDKGKKNITELGLTKSSAKILPKNSILFSSRAPIGYVVIAKNDLSTNQGFKSLVPSEIVESRYCYYYFKSIKQLAEKNARGTTFKELSGTAFGNLPFLLPPLPEQRAIVAKIEELFSELDAGVASLEKAQRQLKVYRQAVLQKAFEGKLTDNLSTPNPSTLEFLIEKPRYGTSKRCLPEEKGIPVLRIPNIRDGKINTDQLKYAFFDEREISTLALQEGDILTIRSNGSVDIVGKCALVTKKDTEYLYAGYLIRIRPNKEKINSKYLLYCMGSHNLRMQIESKAKSTSGVNNINSAELASLIIPMFELREQQQIVQEIESRLSVVEDLEKTIASQLEKSQALRQSILKKAFSGILLTKAELEACRQEPDWCPAAELVKKMKT